MRFTLDAIDGRARAATIELPHGTLTTPVFMPVGTQGTVKAMTPALLEEIGTQIILGNTYHLFLRPGADIIAAAQGLHRFSAWQRPILTDSGGYQVYSLAKLRRINDRSVTFQSHIDGSIVEFTPESVVAFQELLGVDIMMQLDECPPATADRDRIAAAVQRSLLWAQRSRNAWQRDDCALFGIVQGGLHADLRAESAAGLIGLDLPGYALGGFSVGEDMQQSYPAITAAAALLPPDKPRYLMGIGFPEDIVRAVGFGLDMFDCVLPTRCARNGLCFYSEGRLRIKNACYRDDMRPIDPQCTCYTCRTVSRAYLRHLFMAGEISACVLMTIHNLHYYLDLCRRMRTAITEGRFQEFHDSFLASPNNSQQGQNHSDMPCGEL
jgi:queuine tRNA-ribosyltransferase